MLIGSVCGLGLSFAFGCLLAALVFLAENRQRMATAMIAMRKWSWGKNGEAATRKSSLLGQLGELGGGILEAFCPTSPSVLALQHAGPAFGSGVAVKLPWGEVKVAGFLTLEIRDDAVKLDNLPAREAEQLRRAFVAAGRAMAKGGFENYFLIGGKGPLFVKPVCVGFPWGEEILNLSQVVGIPVARSGEGENLTCVKPLILLRSALS